MILRKERLLPAAIALMMLGSCMIDDTESGPGCSCILDDYDEGTGSIYGGGNGSSCYCGDGYCGSCDTLSNCEIDCARCGDGHCSRFDIDCPQDCPDQIECGDGRCDDMYGEECPEDCEPENCGDGWCDWDGEFGERETSENCFRDCHCWNANCEPELGEDELTCWQDCSECGNGVCGPIEDFWICPEDCERPVECSDMICEHFETEETCRHDCWCGNGTCDPAEALDGTCPDECGEEPLCGNGVCDEDEDWRTCVYDCAECTDPAFPVYCEDGLGCWPRGTNCDSNVFDCGSAAWRCGDIADYANCCADEFATCDYDRPFYCPADGECYNDPERCADDSTCDYTGVSCYG